MPSCVSKYDVAIFLFMKVITMNFWIHVLEFLDTQMEKPEPYGWFHLLFFGLAILLTVVFAVWHRGKQKHVRFMLLFVSILVFLLEIYKQINYSFSVSDGGIAFDYQWYAFPFQFCSTPMYVGLLAGILGKGKLHDCLCAYLATYAIFAGAAVMLYPTSIFIGTIGINIQSLICHGSMIFLGVYLFATGHVKLRHKTILRALPVFAVMVLIAATGNEIAHLSGLLETEDLNLFFISPYCEPHLPVYSSVQALVPFPYCLIIYILGFTAAAYIMPLLAMLSGRMCHRKNKKSELA